MDLDEEFTTYYAERGARMRAFAYLLCGDWYLAEDLVQTAFVKLYLAWHRVTEQSTLDQYVRQIIVRTLLDERRRPWRRERPTGSIALVDRACREPEIVNRLWMRDALTAVPARQRATLVLRFWEDLSVADTARLLGVSEGTVKSHTTRGLKALRDLLGGCGDLDARHAGRVAPPPIEEVRDERT